MPKAKEPGFRGPLHIPDENEMRPSIRHPEDRDGPGRDVLRYSTGEMDFCQDFESDSSRTSTSPASARFTPGLPERKPRESKDGDDISLQPGIRRP